jgi:hypothetical protein
LARAMVPPTSKYHKLLDRDFKSHNFHGRSGNKT